MSKSNHSSRVKNLHYTSKSWTANVIRICQIAMIRWLCNWVNDLQYTTHVVETAIENNWGDINPRSNLVLSIFPWVLLHEIVAEDTVYSQQEDVVSFLLPIRRDYVARTWPEQKTTTIKGFPARRHIACLCTYLITSLAEALWAPVDSTSSKPSIMHGLRAGWVREAQSSPSSNSISRGTANLNCEILCNTWGNICRKLDPYPKLSSGIRRGT